jgi:hypothetical protein
VLHACDPSNLEAEARGSKKQNKKSAQATKGDCLKTTKQKK